MQRFTAPATFFEPFSRSEAWRKPYVNLQNDFLRISNSRRQCEIAVVKIDWHNSWKLSRWISKQKAGKFNSNWKTRGQIVYQVFLNRFQI